MLCQRLRILDDKQTHDKQFLRGLTSAVDDLEHPNITVGNDWQGEFSTVVVPDFSLEEVSACSGPGRTTMTIQSIDLFALERMTRCLVSILWI